MQKLSKAKLQRKKKTKDPFLTRQKSKFEKKFFFFALKILLDLQWKIHVLVVVAQTTVKKKEEDN